MLETLRSSTEAKNYIDLARQYLYGVKGSIVQDKKRKMERQAASLSAIPGQDGLQSRPGASLTVPAPRSNTNELGQLTFDPSPSRPQIEHQRNSHTSLQRPSLSAHDMTDTTPHPSGFSQQAHSGIGSDPSPAQTVRTLPLNQTFGQAAQLQAQIQRMQQQKRVAPGDPSTRNE